MHRLPVEGSHAAVHPKSQGPADAGGLLFFGHDHEGDIAFACDLRETEANISRHYRRTIEHYQREDATSKKKVGAPRRSLPFLWPDDDETLAKFSPGLWSQRSTGIDPRHPLARGQNPGHHLPEQCGFAGTQTASDFGDPTSRNPAAQFLIKMGDTGCKGGAGVPACRHDFAHPKPERIEGFRGSLCSGYPEEFGSKHPGSRGREVGERGRHTRIDTENRSLG
jgi:hypothetical protein